MNKSSVRRSVPYDPRALGESAPASLANYGREDTLIKKNSPLNKIYKAQSPK